MAFFAASIPARSSTTARKAVTAPLPPGDGIAQEWFKRDLPDRIRLPGILQAQGYAATRSTPATPRGS